MKPHSQRTPMLGGACLLIVGSFVTTAGEIGAQERPDSLRIEVEQLIVLVDSLRREIGRLTNSGDVDRAEESLAALRAAAEAAAASSETESPSAPQPQDFVGRQRTLQSLNPEISLNADVMSHVNPSDPGTDNFFWREFEVSIQSALDPFSRATVFISRHGEGPEIVPFGGEHGEHDGDGHGATGGFDIEEGFVEWVSLPGGLGLKFGKFFQRFGTLNRWHAHALDFQSRSLPHITLLGEESLAQTGASVTWMAPFGGGSAGTYEATVEVTQSDSESLFGTANTTTVLAHVNGFWQLSNSTDLEFGGTWLNGRYEDEVESHPRSAYNIEVAFNWIPPSRSRRTGLTLRGGYILLDGLHTSVKATAVDPAGAPDTAGGLWSMGTLRLSPTWLVGARFDRVQNPADPAETQWMASPTLTWWQSEFVRIRGEYDFLSGVDGGSGTGMFILQATFAMGPHRHATY